jgi:hypothetical protein
MVYAIDAIKYQASFLESARRLTKRERNKPFQFVGLSLPFPLTG